MGLKDYESRTEVSCGFYYLSGNGHHLQLWINTPTGLFRRIILTLQS